jgi:hypothetical protein
VQEPQCERVWLLNMLTFSLHNGNCPYHTEQTRWGNCTEPPPEVAEAAAAELRELSAAAVARGRLGLGSGLGFGDQGWHVSATAATESKRLAAALGASEGSSVEEGADESMAREVEAATKAAAAAAKASEVAAGGGGGLKFGTGSGPGKEGKGASASREGDSGANGSIGIMDINPILVRAAGSAAGDKAAAGR